MHHVAPADSLQERSSRAPLKHPVRVTIAGERVVRVLSGDISSNGMFLQMPEPPEPGTVVTLAFEAGGKVLPFAEGEVAWRRSGERGGFGVRFTHFLHARAGALIQFLCENVEGGTTLKAQPPPSRVSPSRRWSGLALIAATATFLITWTFTEPARPVTLEPGLTCAPPPSAAPTPKPVELALSTPAVEKKPVAKAPARLPEKPRAVPVMTRTAASAVKPAPFSSTPIPSGAARLVNVSRVSGALRVAVDAVAGGRVSNVATLQNPARLVIDVAGLPPISNHQISLSDSELRSISVAKQGKGTRLVIELVRLPTRVKQQGDSAVLTF